MTRRERLLEAYRHKDTGYCPCLFSDANVIKPLSIGERAERGGKDWFGVDWSFVEKVGAPMVTPGSKRLSELSRWREELVFPDLSAYDFASAAAEDTKNWDRENKFSYLILINGPFERLHSFIGMEEALLSMYTEPEAFKALINAITDYKIELIKIIGKYWKPDVLHFEDDYGSGRNMLMSPDMWREFFKEPLRRIAAAIHENGMFYEHHSCGYIAPIVGDLADIGVDALDPLQVCNPVRELKDRYQNRLAFVGGFDNQGVFDRPGATEERVRAETARGLRELAPGGSFVAFVLSQSFIPAFIDEHRRYQRELGIPDA